MIHNIRDLRLLLRLLIRNPVEFKDRANLLLQARESKIRSSRQRNVLYQERLPFSSALERLSKTIGEPLDDYLTEPEFQDVMAHVSKMTHMLSGRPGIPFPVIFNADPTLACLAYLLCRIERPSVAIETGVGYGVTSAMILAGLHRNGCGTLHSIDLPPLRDRETGSHIGIMIPEKYRSSWKLHIGTSSRVLPKLTRELGTVGLFIHDSCNLQRVQEFELGYIWPHLASSAAVVVNNIGGKSAFAKFVTDRRIPDWLTIEQQEKKGDLTGLILRHQ